MVIRYFGEVAAIAFLATEILVCFLSVWRFLSNEGSTFAEFFTTPTEMLFEAPPVVCALCSLAFLAPGIYIILTAGDPAPGNPEEMTLTEQSVFGVVFTCLGIGLLGVTLPVLISQDNSL